MAEFPPFWKVRRELLRLLRRSLNPFYAARTGLSYLLSAVYYDWFRAREVQVFKGQLPLEKQVAIYLIFPSDGLLQSHLDSLNYIVSSGYSPIVVSNLPLPVADRQRLLAVCHAYIQRPNFGYDFGGYREAIKFLDYDLAKFERLAILNDSCWFPVPNGGDWLAMAKALDVDYAAAASNYGIERRDASDYKSITWEYRSDHWNFHYCSFALLISKRILQDRGFQRFWRRFPMTADKSRTVRRGEIGLSQWVIRRGFTHAATYEVTHLDQELKSLSFDRLMEVLRNLVIPEDKRLVDIKMRLLEECAPDREAVSAFILATVARQGSSYSLADYTINERAHAFLKKTPIYLDEDASDTSLRIIREMPGERGKTILREALALREKRAPTFRKDAGYDIS